MFHALEVVTVLASMLSTVFTLGVTFENCSEICYELLDKGLESRYEIHPIQVVISMPDITVQGDFQRRVVYAYSINATIDYKSDVMQVQFGVHSKTKNDKIQNSSLSWSYAFVVAGTANIVPGERTAFYKVDNEGCQLYTFTREEEWQYKNQDKIELPANFPLDRIDTPAEIKTVVYNLTFSCLKQKICEHVRQYLAGTRQSNPSDKSPPLQLLMKINEAVDKSVRRLQKDIKERHSEKIELGNITTPFSTNVQDRSYSGEIVSTGGTFEQLSTIERIGDAHAVIQGNMYNITSTYTFGEARVQFDHCKFHFENVPFSGGVSATIKDLQIQVGRLGFRQLGVCNESSSLSVLKIDTFEYKFSGPNANESLLPTIWGWISSPWEMEMKKMLSVYIKENLLRHGADDYSDNIFGLCMSNSSKVSHDIRTPHAN